YEPLTQSDGDSATLFVTSNDELHPVTQIPLSSGHALVLPDCDLTAAPVSLAFNQIALGQVATLPVTLTNAGPTECLVDGLALAPDSDPSFQLVNNPAIPTAVVLGPSGDPPGQLQALVRFAPSKAGTFTGTLGFTTSSHSASAQAIPISGSAASGC